MDRTSTYQEPDEEEVKYIIQDESWAAMSSGRLEYESVEDFAERRQFLDGRGFDVYLDAMGLPSGSPYFLSWD